MKIALFGLENQAAPDLQMPLRFYSYNGASYKAQMLPDKPDGRQLVEEGSPDAQMKRAEREFRNDAHFNQKQPFYPVLTLVLYFGLRRWNTAKTLYEAVQIPDELRPFIPDMPINLVEVAWLEDEVIDRFQSDFKVVAAFFKQLRQKGDKEIDLRDPALSQPIKHFLELMRLMSAYSGAF